MSNIDWFNQAVLTGELENYYRTVVADGFSNLAYDWYKQDIDQIQRAARISKLDYNKLYSILKRSKFSLSNSMCRQHILVDAGYVVNESNQVEQIDTILKIAREFDWKGPDLEYMYREIVWKLLYDVAIGKAGYERIRVFNLAAFTNAGIDTDTFFWKLGVSDLTELNDWITEYMEPGDDYNIKYLSAYEDVRARATNAQMCSLSMTSPFEPDCFNIKSVTKFKHLVEIESSVIYSIAKHNYNTRNDLSIRLSSDAYLMDHRLEDKKKYFLYYPDYVILDISGTPKKGYFKQKNKVLELNSLLGSNKDAIILLSPYYYDDNEFYGVQIEDLKNWVSRYNELKREIVYG